MTTLRVQGLTSLEALLLQGNQIEYVDEVGTLSKLPHLRTLAFQNRDEPDETNPMCAHPAYRVTIRRLLPQLHTLDGERVALTAAASGEADGADPLAAALAAAEAQPWFTDADLDVAALGGGGEKGTPHIAGAAEFEQALVDAKRSSARAKTFIDDFKREAGKTV